MYEHETKSYKPMRVSGYFISEEVNRVRAKSSTDEAFLQEVIVQSQESLHL